MIGHAAAPPVGFADTPLIAGAGTGTMADLAFPEGAGCEAGRRETYRAPK